MAFRVNPVLSANIFLIPNSLKLDILRTTLQFKGIYRRFTWGGEGRPETTKLSHYNATNYI